MERAQVNLACHWKIAKRHLARLLKGVEAELFLDGFGIQVEVNLSQL
jgi:hypothetical protein